MAADTKKRRRPPADPTRMHIQKAALPQADGNGVSAGKITEAVMFGRHRYRDGYEDGVEETIAVILNRADRTGGIIDARLAEVEIRSLLLAQHPAPHHDPLR
jgi:hypothetical protein